MSNPTVATLPPPPSASFWALNPVFLYLSDVSTAVAAHRKLLGLQSPGTVENLHKEVSRDVLPTQYFFLGLRADLNKLFNFSPVFQTSHLLSAGAATPAYLFSAVLANEQLLLQAFVDNEGSVNGKLNYAYGPHVTKFMMQLGQDFMNQIEHEYAGQDSTVNVKLVNSLFLLPKFTGIATALLLQSVTPKLALGIEACYSRQMAQAPPDVLVNYFARYAAPKYVAAATLHGQGLLVATFWRKISENVECGVETTLQLGQRPVPALGVYELFVDGQTQIGAKYEYRTLVFRGAVDSTGKVSVTLERRLLPMILVLYCSELDNAKNTVKVGMGVQFDTFGTEQVMLMQQGLVDQNGNPVPGAGQL